MRNRSSTARRIRLCGVTALTAVLLGMRAQVAPPAPVGAVPKPGRPQRIVALPPTTTVCPEDMVLLLARNDRDYPVVVDWRVENFDAATFRPERLMGSTRLKPGESDSIPLLRYAGGAEPGRLRAGRVLISVNGRPWSARGLRVVVADDCNDPDPNTPDPNGVDPNTPDPNSVDPNTPDPNSVDPNTPDPNDADPNMPPDPNDPNDADPNAPPDPNDPNDADPNTPPDPNDPNDVDPNAPPDPNSVDPNTPDPNDPNSCVVLRGVKRVDIDTDSDNNGVIDDSDDRIETQAPGKYIRLNNDDDDGDGLADQGAASNTPGENDLVPVRLSMACVSDHYDWRLRFPDKVRIWREPTRTGRILSNVRYWFKTDPLPSTLYVEGYQASDAAGDIRIELTQHKHGVKWATGYDRVNVTVVGVTLQKCPAGFIPRGGAEDNQALITVTVAPASAAGQLQFELFDVSDEKGYCLNAPAVVPPSGEDSDGWKDLQFKPQAGYTISGANNSVAETDAADLHEATVAVTSYDYGAFGKVRGRFIVNQTVLEAVEQGTVRRETRIPLDEDENEIADGAAQNSGPGASKDAADDNDDAPVGNGTDGDRLTRYEEYRGFMVSGTHTRTDAGKKDVFYRDADGVGHQQHWTEANLGAPIHKLASGELDTSRAVTFNSESHEGPGQRAIVQRENTNAANPTLRRFFWGESTVDIPYNVTVNVVYTDNQTYGIRSGTTLQAAIGASDTVIAVELPDPMPQTFSSPGRFKIENEIVQYAVIQPMATKLELQGVTRGVGGTAAAAHATGARVAYFSNPDEVIAWAVAHECGHAVGINHDTRLSPSLMTQLPAGAFELPSTATSFRTAGAPVAGSTQEFRVK